jgi:hypothetical protein
MPPQGIDYSAMRFVFTPAEDNPYDWRMLRRLSGAIAGAGHQVTLLPPMEYTIGNLRQHDIVFDINRSRPGWLPAGVLHIAWVQDFRPGTTPYYGERKGKNDLIYAMADSDALGLPAKWVDGVLLTGVDKELLTYAIPQPSIDISICGYIPPPLEQFEFPDIRWPGPVSFGIFCHNEMDKIYKPLSGSLRGNLFMEPLRAAFIETLSRDHEIDKVEEAWRRIVEAVGYWIIDHPRRADRFLLASMVLTVSDNCLFQGNNWNKYPEFAKVSAPHTKDEKELYGVYSSSKINLHTNSHGFGPHSRVLEAMAVGGFIMTHVVSGEPKIGLMNEYFEPNVHFGEFTSDNFVDHAKFWLKNMQEREFAIAESRKIIAAKHLWEHRGAQVLKDLGL